MRLTFKDAAGATQLTGRFCHKKQSVDVQGDNRCWFWEPYEAFRPKWTVWANMEFFYF